MINRTKNITRTVHREREETENAKYDEYYNKIGTKEIESVDVKKTSPLKLLGAALTPIVIAFTFIVFFGGFLIGRDPDISRYAEHALPTEIVEAGAVLAKEDQKLATKNYTISLPTGGETTIMIVWDYAAEDGDMVSVLFDGKPMGDSFVISHAPKTIKVPKNSKVDVIGTFDGGGGITYAVNFPEIQKTILNGLDSGEQNIYSLVPMVK